ncbi:JAB domain-containing protein [Neobacillus cucumis]|uniref:DNA repair protein RadC n=1 Tax=Neobacillus cucumis TaxID=1740721 RepID=A0A2N5H8V3_9BACI|nr:JAB domain-containing protein [Neobacillus cucumis]PLS01940.1 DNA repair protein RadC [Neobacillus cucumis]
MQQAVKEEKTRMRRLSVVSLQMVKEKTYPFRTNTIRSPLDVVDLVREFIGNADRENFIVISLSTKNTVTNISVAHRGSINASIVHPRETFKTAVLSNAASIIVAHNHPSGNCQPSKEDIEVTKRLNEAGKILGIELLDHCIISDSDSYSMKEHGYI